MAPTIWREHMGWQAPMNRSRVRSSSLSMDHPWEHLRVDRMFDDLIKADPTVSELQRGVRAAGGRLHLDVVVEDEMTTDFQGPIDTNASFKARERATRSHRDVLSLAVYGALRNRGAVIGVAIGLSVIAIVTGVVGVVMTDPSTVPFYFYIGWWVAFFACTILGGWAGHEHDRARRQTGERT